MAFLRLGLFLAVLAQATPVAASPVERWSAHVAEASMRFGLPQSWIRQVMQAESGGRTGQAGRPIVSPAGAMGLMQLMPGTWQEMRAMLRLGADPFDPRDNILAGSAYLRLMYDRFGYPGLFGAYNAGPARYALHLAGRRRLPAETRSYMAGISGRISGHLIAAPGSPALFVPARLPQARGTARARAATSPIFVQLRTAGSALAAAGGGEEAGARGD